MLANLERLARLGCLSLLIIHVIVSHSEIAPAGQPAKGSRRVQVRERRQLRGFCPSRASRDFDNERSRLLYHSVERSVDVELRPRSGSSWRTSDLNRMLDEGFNVSQPTLMYLHAYLQSSQSGWLREVRNRYERLVARSGKTFNLLFFDWSAVSRSRYDSAASAVPLVGDTLASFLRELASSQSYDLAKMHVIAYSLSTHIAGWAGRQLAKGNRLGQITALDPTGVCFQTGNQFALDHTLRPSDAKRVVARHYDMNRLGAKMAIGGVDIFVNGGVDQPGTLYKRDLEDTLAAVAPDDDEGAEEDEDPGLVVGQRRPYSGYGGATGDHGMAAAHETAEHGGRCLEVAYSCASYSAFLAGECADCGAQGQNCYYLDNMGALDYLNRGAKLRLDTYRPKLKMYLKTGPSSGFCLHHYQVLVRLAKGEASSGAREALKSGALSVKLNSQLSVRPTNELDEYTFTALLTSSNLIRLEKPIRIQVDSTARNAVGAIQSLELNYMSHPIASERKKRSAKFCKDNKSQSLKEC